ncbi:MAG: hypothetical protein ACRDVG_02180 [Jatrophihabitantaceae bacterium]
MPAKGVPAGMDSLLTGLLSTLSSFQIKADFVHLPGGAKDTVLKGSATKTFTFRTIGRYTFTWIGQNVTFLGAAPVQLDGGQIAQLTKDKIAVSRTSTYTATVVVATNPPSGQIGVQLPKQSISVGAGPIHTSVNLPGATVGVPNPLPGIVSNLPNLPGTGGGTGGTKNGPGSNVNYTPPALTVPERVMPHAVNFGGAAGTGYAAPGGAVGAANVVGGHIVAPAQATTTAAPVVDPSNVANAQPANKTTDLSSKDGLSGAQLPAVLAILAILALSGVTAAYARMYLLRKS